MRNLAASPSKTLGAIAPEQPYHNPMDIYLDQITSLHITRAVLCDQSLGLVTAEENAPTAIDTQRFNLSRLGMGGLLAYLQVPESRSLGVVVPHANDRIRTAGTRCSVDSSTSRKGTYLQLVSVDAEHPSALVPPSTCVFVQSPPKIVLAMAKTIARHVHAQELSREVGVLRLVKLCLELCGTYAHDPFDPLCGDVTYKTKPLTNIQQIRDFLEPRGREPGLRMAREAANLAYDLSGSPQESFLGPALFYPSRYGGLTLCDYKANEELQLTKAEKALIHWRTITPDFQLVGYQAAVEYLGHVHEEGDNPRIDHKRRLDYQTLGKRVFEFWYDDVKTISALNQSALRLVAAIEQSDGPGARKRFKQRVSSKGFLAKQKDLFEVFRPWLR